MYHVGTTFGDVRRRSNFRGHEKYEGEIRGRGKGGLERSLVGDGFTGSAQLSSAQLYDRERASESRASACFVWICHCFIDFIT
jgi:hypothetical protein